MFGAGLILGLGLGCNSCRRCNQHHNRCRCHNGCNNRFDRCGCGSGHGCGRDYDYDRYESRHQGCGCRDRY